MLFTKLASLLLLATLAQAKQQLGLPTNLGTYYQNVSFTGANPSNVGMNIYVPPSVTPNAPLLVVLHWCTGTGNDLYMYSAFPGYADKAGFVILYPSSPNLADHCWDLSSKATLTHNGGGDAQGLASMIEYAITKYGSDRGRVFITGVSSGAMMTEHMAGVYPDVFTAGAGFAGVPFGCYADVNGGVDTWSNQCATGSISHTGAEWATIVRNAYPSYSGYRPHLQLYHGTADATVSYNNLGESVKEWTTVMGISATPVSTATDTPLSGWTRNVYGNGELTTFSGAGVPHDVPFRQDDVAAFFDLLCPAGNATCFRRGDIPTPLPTATTTPTTTITTLPTTTPTATTTKTPTTTPTPTSTSTGVPKWGQCGGINYTGSTTCIASTCTFVNDWYSQCL